MSKAFENWLLARMHRALTHIAEALNIPLTFCLWDGSTVAAGEGSEPEYRVRVSDRGVIASLLKRPTPENLIRHYATGNVAIEGGNLIDIGEAVRKHLKKHDIGKVSKNLLLRQLWPFLFVRKTNAGVEHAYPETKSSPDPDGRESTDYIQFHYDVSNEFYQLFLDPEMQYSCGYFENWSDTLEQAQLNKLDMICRKLRLQAGDRFLDIGCGWGGLICHAAQNFGARAHGITLSQKQYDFALEKIGRLGLQDRVTVEIRDYQSIEGRYDKVASIGMFEHIGVENFPIYFRKVQSLMRDHGIFLNHGIARRSRSKRRKPGHITAEKRILQKYIFPGTELVPVGDTINTMEERGFEVHDVEAWREHYALTCRNWCLRLSDNRERAIERVGFERYNLWVAYLAGVAFGFAAGNMLIFQVVASKRGKEKGPSGMPPTRADLYVPFPSVSLEPA